MSQSIEDYLKGIYILSEKKVYSNKNLSEYLKISPASVSEMIKKLAKEDYVTLNERKLKLTEKGKNKAKNIIRKHRVWEVFLVEKLGYDINDIHDEAEILEHVTSEKLLKKLEKFLFYPKECPHGSPIFYNEDNFSEDKVKQLSEIDEDESVVILSVDENIELYDYLKELDIKIKEEYTVIKKDPFNGPVYLKSDKNVEKIIAFEATKFIRVYLKSEDSEEVENISDIEVQDTEI